MPTGVLNLYLRTPALFTQTPILWIVAIVACVVHCPPSRVDFILETATIGPGGSPGLGIGGLQWLGARFSLSDTYQITEIGGRLSGAISTFAAIVDLDGPQGLPSGVPNDITANARVSALLNLSLNVDDYLAQVSLVLGPGNYGLVLGIGPFGAQGGGNTDTSGTPIPPASFFRADPLGLEGTPAWYDASELKNLRFLVNGTRVVPEPSRMGLLLSGVLLTVLALGGRLRRA
jgi:hypothetical protein